jgi:GAF domain-containing protein
MGKRLQACFEEADRLGGLVARMRLASMSQVSATETNSPEDKPEFVETSCFSASYLTPLGINSMLDVPVMVNKSMVGVICHEHVGPKRTWNVDEETFAYLMSNFVSLALERRSP